MVDSFPVIPNPWRGMICFSLAIGFEEDRARLGLPAAVDRLRDALHYNDQRSSQGMGFLFT
jgi:hypothetical protein